jgi:hypothetical protein
MHARLGACGAADMQTSAEVNLLTSWIASFIGVRFETVVAALEGLGKREEQT